MALDSLLSESSVVTLTAIGIETSGELSVPKSQNNMLLCNAGHRIYGRQGGVWNAVVVKFHFLHSLTHPTEWLWFKLTILNRTDCLIGGTLYIYF